MTRNLVGSFSRVPTIINDLNVLVIDDRYGNDAGLWEQFKHDTGLEQRAYIARVLSGQVVQGDNGTRVNDYELATILPVLEERDWSLILLDLQFISTGPGKDKKKDNIFGAFLYKEIKKRFTDLHIVMLTSEHQQALPVEIAYAPYISKEDLDWDELVCRGFLSNGCAGNKKLTVEQKRALLELTNKEAAGSDIMLDVFREAYIQAKTDTPVCILGESGSGKEVIANYIHRISREGHPFITTGMGEHNSADQAIDIGTIFGIGKPIASGVPPRPGLIEEAKNGTLFFDEIGDMAPQLQAACLRFLEDKEYKPMGVNQSIKSKCRLLFATDRDLRDPTILRHQIFERIHVNQAIVVPPLRDHKEDISELAETFLQRACTELGKKGIKLDGKALTALRRHDFPNNVRSLKNIIFYLVTLKGKRNALIREEDVNSYLARLEKPLQQTTGTAHCLADVLECLKTAHIDKLDPGLNGETGTMLEIEKAYIGTLKRATEAAMKLKNGKLAPAVSYMLGKDLKSDIRFNYLLKGESLVRFSDLLTKTKPKGRSGNKKTVKPT